MSKCSELTGEIERKSAADRCKGRFMFHSLAGVRNISLCHIKERKVGVPI